MRLLLDTHIFIWWCIDDSRLSKAVVKAITKAENEVYVSAASAWEIAIKTRIGKLPDGKKIMQQYDELLAEAGCYSLPIAHHHALLAGGLSATHRDPFDRMLLAQAKAENMTLVSTDTFFKNKGIKVIS